MTFTDGVVVHVIRQIDAFNRKTNDDEYTDTGEAWELFLDIRDQLNDALPSYLQIEDV